MSIGVIFGIHKGRNRKNKSLDEIERDIQELNQEMLELNDEEMAKAIEEMTVFFERIDKMLKLDTFIVNENEIEINRLNDMMFYYGCVHGGPYGAVNYLSKNERAQVWQRLMEILVNNAQAKRIGP